MDQEYSNGESEVEWRPENYWTMMLSAWYSYHAEGADETNEYGVDGVHDALLANGEVFSYHSSADNSDEAGERIALIATETGKKILFDPRESLGSLKSKLSRALGFPPERQHLFAGEKELVSKS